MAEDRDQQGQQEFNDKVVAKIKEDPDFLGHLLLDPRDALERSGLAEAAKALEEKEGEAEKGQDDVGGHTYYHHYVTYYWTCRWIIYPYRYHRR